MRKVKGIRWDDHPDEQRYVAEVYLGRDSETGKEIKKRFKGNRGDRSENAQRLVKEARDAFIQQQRPRRRGTTNHSRMPFKDYLTDWLANHVLEPSAFAVYTWAVDKYLIPTFGNLRLYDLEHMKDDMKAYFNKKLPRLGQEARKKIRTVGHSACEDAINRKVPLMAVNPFHGFTIARNEEPNEMIVWTIAESERFLAYAVEHEPPMFVAMIGIIVRGGLGPAETHGLKWKDLNWDTGKLSVTRNLVEVGGQITDPKELKTGRKRGRTYRVPAFALKILKDHYDAVKPGRDDFIFTASKGGPIHLNNWRKRVWYPLLEKAEVRQVTPYALRHSTVSLGQALGIPLSVISKIIGHSTTRLTSDVYSHIVTDEDEIDAMVNERFDTFFKKAMTKKKRKAS